MANQSIYDGFERMWQHTSSAIGAKADKEEVEGVVYTKEDEGIDSSAPINADTLGGRPADDYALARDIENITIKTLGAAPAGFGLGEAAVPCADCNDIMPTGFYRITDSTLNRPTAIYGYSYGTMLNIKRDDSSFHEITQVMYTHFNKISFISIRNYDNDKWSEWFYVNPQMRLDEEYATAERWLGRTVYCMTVDLGYLPDNTSKTVETPITESFTEVRYNLTNWAGQHMLTGRDDIRVSFFNGKVRITTTSNLSSTKAYFSLWYTKD